tara:strand:+ start:129 stop:521 length:393 start_codon:yes stop_codon:yes gene_type:complete
MARLALESALFEHEQKIIEINDEELSLCERLLRRFDMLDEDKAYVGREYDDDFHPKRGDIVRAKEIGTDGKRGGKLPSGFAIIHSIEEETLHLEWLWGSKVFLDGRTPGEINWNSVKEELFHIMRSNLST